MKNGGNIYELKTAVKKKQPCKRSHSKLEFVSPIK